MKNPAPAIDAAWNKIREVARLRHLSIRTEECYLHWIQRFWRFHQQRNRE